MYLFIWKMSLLVIHTKGIERFIMPLMNLLFLSCLENHIHVKGLNIIAWLEHFSITVLLQSVNDSWLCISSATAATGDTLTCSRQIHDRLRRILCTKNHWDRFIFDWFTIKKRFLFVSATPYTTLEMLTIDAPTVINQKYKRVENHNFCCSWGSPLEHCHNI